MPRVIDRRRAFLKRMADAGRMRVILGKPVPPGQVQQTWLCIFHDVDVRKRMVRATAGFFGA